MLAFLHISLPLGFVPPIITQPLTTSQMTYPRPVVSTGVNRNQPSWWVGNVGIENANIAGAINQVFQSRQIENMVSTHTNNNTLLSIRQQMDENIHDMVT